MSNPNLRRRQKSRDDWARTVTRAWPSLGPDIREHCMSARNLDNWWPETQPAELELALRQEIAS